MAGVWLTEQGRCLAAPHVYAVALEQLLHDCPAVLVLALSLLRVSLMRARLAPERAAVVAAGEQDRVMLSP